MILKQQKPQVRWGLDNRSVCASEANRQAVENIEKVRRKLTHESEYELGNSPLLKIEKKPNNPGAATTGVRNYAKQSINVSKGVKKKKLECVERFLLNINTTLNGMMARNAMKRVRKDVY